jgi:hypothetical protein
VWAKLSSRWGGRRKIVRLVLIVGLLCCGVALAETAEEPNVWQPFEFFVGSWEGEATGRPGDSEIQREYQFVLQGKFLEVKTKSVFQPQEKNPEGEIHEDWGLISYDQMREKFILREFLVEGFVNQYVLDSLTADPTIMVFETETIENIPVGWRAKTRIEILNENEFIEYFELAAPDKDFACYMENYLTRKE